MVIDNKIQMVDLKGQYSRMQGEIDAAVLACIRSAAFINGPDVKQFEQSFASYLNVGEVIGCANGTDALQIALMALDLQPGDEVIVPAFTYVATAEVIALLKLMPVMADVNLNDFTIDVEHLESLITPKTKVIVPVHLFGQVSNMDAIMQIAARHSLFVVEDNAQAIGSEYVFQNGTRQMAGTIGHIGCTSFFPSKNLGCYGDGGALMTNDPELAKKIRMIANHGQRKKYYHSVIGINSRLDTLQAAVLGVKLKYLNDYIASRQWAADCYNSWLEGIAGLITPKLSARSSHVYHQYTLRVTGGRRDQLQKALAEAGIPSMIYYPVPLYKQEAFAQYFSGNPLANTETLCGEVLSLPMHTELTRETIEFICQAVKNNL